MPIVFLGLALLSAVINWLAVGQNRKWLEYLTKPGVMLFLMGWLWQTGLVGGLPWFMSGLFFSLVGDVVLLGPRSRFLYGLVAFFVAHVAYIAGFRPDQTPISVTGLIVAALVVGLAWAVYRRLRASVPPNLRLPVVAYLSAISGMLLSAWLTFTRPDWAFSPALLVSVGAALFFLSDSLLAWNRFVAPVRHGQVLIMVAYHLGQIGLVLGAAWHFHIG